MYAPVSWIREFVHVDIDAEEVADRLTTAGVEVDGLRFVGLADPHVVAGRVLTLKPHPKDQGLLLVEVDIGAAAPIKVVSRAPNLAGAEGRTVAVALDGATIFSVKPGQALETVRAGVSHGARSDGALVSPREIGLGQDHSGVAVLQDLPPGLPLGQALGGGGGEVVLDIAILPNIARCLGVVGVAREVAAILGVDLTPLAPIERTDKIENLAPDRLTPALCRRFSTALLTGVEVGPSPPDIEYRLRLCGVEPVNNVVDASNYVMLELGQPSHAYDADALGSLDLEVRLAQAGETLVTLAQDHQEPPLALPAGAVIVASAGAPVALAGIVGGQAAAIHAGAHRVLIEAATFSPIAIRRSQALTKQHTNASTRFTRGVDPALTILALDRIVTLIKRTSPDATLEWIRDASLGDEDVVRTLSVTMADIDSRLGVTIPIDECRGILERLGLRCQVAADRQTLTVSVNSSRQDIQGVADLLEEVARIHGYDDIGFSLPADPIAGTGRSGAIAGRELARSTLVEAGLREIITYSLTSPSIERRLYAANLVDEDPPWIALLNPQSVERSVLRRSLLPEMLMCVARNQRQDLACHVFEIGAVYLADKPGPSAGLPAQPTRVALAMSGPIAPPTLHDPVGRAASFFDAAEVVDLLGRRLGLGELEWTSAAVEPFQSNACAALMSNGVSIGHLGLIHPLAARAFELSQPVVAAELDLQALLDAARGPVRVRELSRYPQTTFDLSFVTPESLAVGELMRVSREALGERLLGLTVFDVYRGPGLPDGHKAVGLRFVVGALTHAISQDEGQGLASSATAAIRQHLGVELRR